MFLAQGDQMIRKIRKLLLLVLTCPSLVMKLIIRRSRLSISRRIRGAKIEPIDGVKFEYDFEYAPHVNKMYFGLYEPLVIHTLQRFLNRGDIFIDVGSNIGYLSAVGCSLVGKNGSVYCFEPSPREFEKLEKLAPLNPGYDIQCFNVACGEAESTLELDVSHVFGWNTLVPDFMRKDVYQETVKVNVVRLDDFILEKISQPEKIKLIKIDVEGYEYYVLRGLRKFFQLAKPFIVCEITPRGSALLGIKLEAIASFMKEMGYKATHLINPKFEIDLINLTYQEDILFVPVSKSGF